METPSPPPPSSSPSSAASQAQARKARREAKIRAGGSARLSKITSMGGRPSAGPTNSDSDIPLPADDAPAMSIPTPLAAAGDSALPSASSQKHPSVDDDDPEEVDISASPHYYSPAEVMRRREARQKQQQQQQRQQQAAPSEAELRQMMLGMQGGVPAGAGTTFDLPAGAEDDPMARLLAQVMGGGGVPGMGGGPMGMGFGGLGAQQQTQQQQPQTQAQRLAYVWKIVHALFALALGVYVVWGSEFTGRKSARSSAWRQRRSSDGGEGRDPVQVFWLFATGELLLQSTRFWIEGSRLVGTGLLATVAGLLPSPYGEYVTVAGRYIIIASTVVADAMVLIFVLGAVTWWRSL